MSRRSSRTTSWNWWTRPDKLCWTDSRIWRTAILSFSIPLAVSAPSALWTAQRLRQGKQSGLFKIILVQAWSFMIVIQGQDRRSYEEDRSPDRRLRRFYDSLEAIADFRTPSRSHHVEQVWACPVQPEISNFSDDRINTRGYLKTYQNLRHESQHIFLLENFWLHIQLITFNYFNYWCFNNTLNETMKATYLR